MAQLAMALAPDERVPVVRVRRRPRLRLVYSAPPQLELWAQHGRRLPLVRGDCANLGNPDAPCPYVSCRHHLFSDETRWEEFEALLEARSPAWGYTCSLAVADAVDDAVPGEAPPGLGRLLSERKAERLALLDVGRHMGCSGERARQLENSAKAKVGDAAEIVDAYEEIDWDGDHDPEDTPRRNALIRAHRFGVPVDRDPGRSDL